MCFLKSHRTVVAETVWTSSCHHFICTCSFNTAVFHAGVRYGFKSQGSPKKSHMIPEFRTDHGALSTTSALHWTKLHRNSGGLLKAVGIK